MVYAILAGQKTQTRRVVKEPFQSWMNGATNPKWWNGITENCKYQKGDILWVRETFLIEKSISNQNHYEYRADYTDTMADEVQWKPSIFMPRDAARIFLKVLDVRVERLNDISSGDCENEGLWFYSSDYREEICIWRSSGEALKSVRLQFFKQLWDSINVKKHPWASNPWVWVIEFERIEKP